MVGDYFFEMFINNFICVELFATNTLLKESVYMNAGKLLSLHELLKVRKKMYLFILFKRKSKILSLHDLKSDVKVWIVKICLFKVNQHRIGLKVSLCSE